MFSCVSAPVEALSRDFDVSQLTAGQAVAALRELASIRNSIDGLIGRVGVQVEESGAYKMRGERSAAAFVARELGERVGDVRALLDAAAKVRLLPEVDAAVREGRLSARQTKMIAGAAAKNPDATDRLLKAANDSLTALRDECIAARAEVEDPAERSARQKKSQGHRSFTDDDGMVAWTSRFTPELGAQLNARVEAETQKIFRARRADGARAPLESYAAEAIANLILGTARTKGGVDTQLFVFVDHGTLTGSHVSANPVCEIPGVGPVDPDWVRSLLGSAFVTAVINKGKDIATVARLGRHVPIEVQCALTAQGHECTIKGCGLRGYLERDHHHDYAKGGPTSLENLGWLCWYHHQRKTRGWILGPSDRNRKRTLRPPP